MLKRQKSVDSKQFEKQEMTNEQQEKLIEKNIHVETATSLMD